MANQITITIDRDVREKLYYLKIKLGFHNTTQVIAALYNFFVEHQDPESKKDEVKLKTPEPDEMPLGLSEEELKESLKDEDNKTE